MKGYSQKYVCEDYVYKVTRNTGFYILRQGVPEGCSSKGYASFKQVKPGPWHKKVIPGDSGERQTDRQTETERHRHRHTDRETETVTETDFMT